MGWCVLCKFLETSIHGQTRRYHSVILFRQRAIHSFSYAVRLEEKYYIYTYIYIIIYERLRNRFGSTNMSDSTDMSDSTNMPDYIMRSYFNLRIQKQAWFHCDVKLSQTCPIRSLKHAWFYKETTLSFHLVHVYNSVRVSMLLLYYKTIDISEWKV